MFRLRETLLFRNVQLQALVSSTRNATFKKQVASRLRETLVFFENCALVYAKHYFFASRRMGLSRQAPCASWKSAPRRPGPVTSRSCHFLCTLCGKMTCKFRSENPARTIWLEERNVLACEQLTIRFHEGPISAPTLSPTPELRVGI